MSYRIRFALLAAALIGTPMIARADVSEADAISSTRRR
jgi:hypothetical protein